MDDERLKKMCNIGADYFDELLERIRDIRTCQFQVPGTETILSRREHEKSEEQKSLKKTRYLWR